MIVLREIESCDRCLRHFDAKDGVGVEDEDGYDSIVCPECMSADIGASPNDYDNRLTIIPPQPFKEAESEEVGK